MSKATRSTLGRVVLMWLPDRDVLCDGLRAHRGQHVALPDRYPLGCPREHLRLVGVNQIPVTIGNILGAMVLNGTLLVLHSYLPEIIAAHEFRRRRKPAPPGSWRRIPISWC